MPEALAEELRQSLVTGHIDRDHLSVEDYRPKLLINDPERQTKVLTSLIQELQQCDSFCFSVAFITNSGVATLIETLRELESKGVRGRILTSQYQNFTEPRALSRLSSLKNIEMRIMTEHNFHAKGYLFRHGSEYSLIVGSSNLTGNALCLNGEWNLKVSSLEDGSIATQLCGEFDRQFHAATVVDDVWIAEYEKIYVSSQIHFPLSYRLDRPSPNKMQIAALAQLEALRNERKDRALIISATGTGKTYLSAFDVKKVCPKRFLFVVHRENIARAAMCSFQKVFDGSKTMGLYTGHEHGLSADYLFATVQTLSKPENYRQFSPDYFEYIVIDEVHRSGAQSYQRLIDYFHPRFLLGMTATPERTDGYDIFKTFHYNIAYEIRLHEALESDMLCPFHYYGVTDISVGGKLLEEDAAFSKLTCPERVKNILAYTRIYGCDHGRTKGLIFCSRVDEAKTLSELLNREGLRTVALDGESTEEAREASIERLEQEDGEDSLDYILTRDIFNEGIDIPCVNQILMLRPTMSAIVFVQQLGRGLRKNEGKEYLTVIDFIGNYANNYLVPIALYGDRSFNKDTIRKLVSAGSALIPGSSTIDFDVIAKERIYKSINSANVSQLQDLKTDYRLLKYKIGRIPTMMDFVNYGARDPYAFVKNPSCGSYYAFLQRVEPQACPPASAEDLGHLEFLSVELGGGKRIAELQLLKDLLEKPSVPLSELKQELSPYDSDDEKTINSAVNVLNGTFFKQQDAQKYGFEPVCMVGEGSIAATSAFGKWKEGRLFREQTEDMIAYGIDHYEKVFAKTKSRGGFLINEKYSRKDACRILDWPKDESSTLYGYRIKNGSCPIFVTYKKREDIAKSTMYDDYLYPDRRRFHWMTRNRVTLDSPEAQAIINAEKDRLRICLFVKKSDGESSDFYYLGDLTPVAWKQLTIDDDQGNTLPVVTFDFALSDPVDDNLYAYLTT